MGFLTVPYSWVYKKAQQWEVEAHVHFRKFFECPPSLWLQKKKEDRIKEEQMGGKEEVRKEIYKEGKKRRERKKGKKSFT